MNRVLNSKSAAFFCLLGITTLVLVDRLEASPQTAPRGAKKGTAAKRSSAQPPRYSEWLGLRVGVTKTDKSVQRGVLIRVTSKDIVIAVSRTQTVAIARAQLLGLLLLGDGTRIARSIRGSRALENAVARARQRRLFQTRARRARLESEYKTQSRIHSIMVMVGTGTLMGSAVFSGLGIAALMTVKNGEWRYPGFGNLLGIGLAIVGGMQLITAIVTFSIGARAAGKSREAARRLARQEALDATHERGLHASLTQGHRRASMFNWALTF